MRLTLLNDKLIDEILAIPIYLSNGVIYANKGIKLTSRHIQNLIGAGLTTLYVEDGNDDINLKEVIPTPVRLEIINSLSEIYSTLAERPLVNAAKVSAIVDKMLTSIDHSENSFIYNNICQKNSTADLVNHSIDVAILSCIVGTHMGLPSDKLHKLTMGALLHDMGKLFMPDNTHPKFGYDYAKNIMNLPVTTYMCMLQHHEYEDGSGYPEKIQSNNISEFAKIVAICNDYVNLVGSKEFTTPDLVVEYLMAYSGTKYNRNVFNHFVETIYCYPNGIKVELSDGRTGVVVLQNKGFPNRPMVGIIENGTPQIINLLTELNLTIVGVRLE